MLMKYIATDITWHLTIYQFFEPLSQFGHLKQYTKDSGAELTIRYLASPSQIQTALI